MEEDKHFNSVIVLSDSSDSEKSVSPVQTHKINNKKACKFDALSDSDDSVSFIETTEDLSNKNTREIDALSDSSFEFPEVNFHYKKGNTESENQKEEIDTDSAFDSCSTGVFPVYDVDNYELGSGSTSSFSKDSQDSAINDIMKKYAILKRAESSVKKKKPKSRLKKTLDAEEERSIPENKNKKQRQPKEKIVDPEKERLKAERQKKKEEQANEKALRALTSKNLKQLKPEECIKSMKIFIDEDIQNRPFFSNILSTMQEAELSFNLCSQLIPQSISWKRQIEENYMSDQGEICTRRRLQDENQIIILWNWNEVVEKIANHTFCKSVESICDLLPQKRITLLIYGIIDYFSYHKNKKDNAIRNEILGNKKPKKGNSKQDKLYRESPEITRHDFELSLTEIQILNNCSSRVVRSSEELALVVYQYTKAIAEMPYKMEKHKNMEDKLSWYAVGDNRDTVKVDKDGNGLKRLWQQQLCQFNLSSLEIAEAICRVYGSPLQLIEVR